MHTELNCARCWLRSEWFDDCSSGPTVRWTWRNGGGSGDGKLHSWWIEAKATFTGNGAGVPSYALAVWDGHSWSRRCSVKDHESFWNQYKAFRTFLWYIRIMCQCGCSLPKVILVCGTPKIVHHGKSLLLNFCNHAKGLSAPPGGLIFIVPSDMISRMPLFEQNFAALQQKFKAQITHVFAGRIQVTGPNQTEVVGQLLRWLQYRGRILFLGVTWCLALDLVWFTMIHYLFFDVFRDVGLKHVWTIL